MVTALLLTAPRWVCEHHAAFAVASPAIAVQRISEYLDTSARQPIARAVALGSMRLLTRVVHSCRMHQLDPFLLEHGLTRAATQAAHAGHRGLVQRLLFYSMEGPPLYEFSSTCMEAVLCGAVCGAQLALLDSIEAQWGQERCRARVLAIATLAVPVAPVAVLQWLHTRQVALPVATIALRAAQRGVLSVLRWLPSVMKEATALTTTMATTSNNPTDDRLAMEAALFGHAHVVQYLVDERHVAITTSLIHTAAYSGDAALMQLLLARAPTLARPSLRLFTSAVQHGHVACVEHMLAHHPELWLQAESGASAVTLLDAAAASSALPVLQWVHAYHQRVHGGAPPLRGAGHMGIAAAASTGQLDILQWLHAHALVDDDDDSHSHGHGGEVWGDAMRAAACGGHVHVVAWLLERQPQAQRHLVGVMDLAAAHGHLPLLRWLHARGIHTRPGGALSARAMDGAAARGHKEVVTFLQTQTTASCTPRAMDQAACHGHLEMVQWLHTHRRRDSDPRSALRRGTERGHTAVVKWLLVHRGGALRLDDVASAAHSLGLVEWLAALRVKEAEPQVVDGDGDAVKAGKKEKRLQWLEDAVDVVSIDGPCAAIAIG